MTTAVVSAAQALSPLRSALRLSTVDASAGPTAEVVLLGTGTVGTAVLQRLTQRAAGDASPTLRLRAVCNSRSRYRATGDGWCRQGDADESPLRVQATLARLRALPPAVLAAVQTDGRDAAAAADGAGFSLEDWCAPHAGIVRLGDVPRILIDATGSDAVAARHAQWLAQGVHVITACKLGQGASLARWRAIRDAQRIGGTRYGDAATVGAGLPVIETLRRLRASGERIHAIAGVLSGSLAWLFDAYDGLRPFSDCVRAAREAGYTEPDPREDLSGEDVRRKLLILARAAGAALEPADVVVESLVPSALASLPVPAVGTALAQLDAPLHARFTEARRNGARLRFIARLDLPVDGPPQARVGLETLPVEHALAGGAGTDNLVAIHSDRYCARPLLIQGPGAGPEVTAAALIDDALAVLHRRH